MEALIDIHAVASQLVKHRVLIEKGSRRVVALMESDYVELVFRTREEVRFSLGDWVEADGLRYEITEPQAPVFNAETLAFEYKLRFDAWYRAWGNKRYRFEPSSGRDECSWALTDTLAAHMAVVVRNMSHHGWTVTWIYSGGGDAAKVAAAQYITFDGDTLLSALTKIAEAFDLEWWVVGTVIHMGRVEYGFADTPVTLRLGHEVAEMSATQTAGRDFFNVFTAYGSERNLPSNYRRSDSQTLQNGVVQRRLMLPREEPLVYVGGVTADSPVAEKVEGVVTFDDVYPRTGGEIATVTPFDETVAATDPTTGDEVRETVTFWRFRDKTLRFLKDYILPGVTLQAVFSSGQLSGMTFDVRFNPQGLAETEAAAQEFEIIRSDTYGMQLPNATLHPAVGDTYSLVGWDATKATDLGLIAAAERELLRRAKEYAATLQTDPNTYTLTLMADWVYGRNGGRLDAAMRKAFALGDRVRIESPALFEGGTRESRVIGLEYGLDVPWDGYKLTVGENVVKSRYSAIQGAVSAAVEQMTFGGAGGTGTADIEGEIETVAKRVGDKRWLSKISDDRAEGNITIGQTLTVDGDTQLHDTRFGAFNSGLTGTGGQIDKDGRAELDTLTLRRFLSVPKLVFNEVSVTKAEQWSTNGYGTIEQVWPDVDASGAQLPTGRARLHLEANDYGSLREGDICRGIYADFTGQHGAREGAVDDCGFTEHRGFFTAYFRVTRVILNHRGEFEFTYEVRTDNDGNALSPHPCAHMDAAQYGSLTDEGRQSSMYQCSRGHGFLEVLEGVDTWEIRPANRVCRYGWLGGVTVERRDGASETLHGHGLWARNNVYFGGAVVQLRDIAGIEDIGRYAKSYDVRLSTYQDTVTVDALGNAIGGLWTERDDGQGGRNRQYSVYTAVEAWNGDRPLLITTDSPGEGQYRVTALSEDCGFTVTPNGQVIITSIANIKDGVAGTQDDTAFDYEAMRRMECASVIVSVECEGRAVRRVTMPVRIVHSDLPFMSLDLTNEMTSVAWNAKARRYTGLPVTTGVRLMLHNEEHPIDTIAATGVPDGLTATFSADRRTLTVSGSPTSDTLPKQADIAVTVTGKYAGAVYEYTRVLTLVKSADCVVYELVPSADCVTVDKSGVLDHASLTCDVYATSSDDGRYKLTAAQMSAAGLTVRRARNGGTESAGASLTLTTDDRSVTFSLYDRSGTLLDRETVPVVAFGVDGKSHEYIFRLTSSRTPVPDTPQSRAGVDDDVPAGWTDDPAGTTVSMPYEWVAVRDNPRGLGWGAFSTPSLYSTYGQQARATLSDSLVTIPMARDGKALEAFVEDITARLDVGGTPLTVTAVSVAMTPASHPGVSVSVTSGNKVRVSCAEDAAAADLTIAVTVTGKSGDAVYSDTANVSVVANVKGEDGDGYEYVYLLTSSATRPSSPERSGGRLTSGWTDDPQEPTASRQYLYVSWRSGEPGADATDFSVPKLFSTFVKAISTTAIQYALSDSGASYPSIDSSSWQSSVPQPTDARPWLWTRTITHYTDGDYDIAYSVSYKGRDGVSVSARYSADGASWHDGFRSGDIYMQTSTDGSTWSPAMRIVGESGANGEHTDFSFAISAARSTSGSATAPSDIGSWSDAPVAVTTAKPYLWCRAVHYDAGGTAGAASYFRLTGEKGEQGIKGERGQSVFTSTVFLRSASVPSAPTGGSYSSPVPTGWSDGVPDGDTAAPLYSSWRVFSSDGLAPQGAAWSAPALMADSADFDVEYCQFTPLIAQPEPYPPGSVLGTYWHNDGTADDNWMATRRRAAGGAWGAWKITMIKGEKGEKGDPGKDGNPGQDGKDGDSYEVLDITLTKGSGSYAFSWTFDGSRRGGGTGQSAWLIDTATKAVESASVSSLSYNTDPAKVLVFCGGYNNSVDVTLRAALARHGGRLDGYWSSRYMAHCLVGQYGLAPGTAHERWGKAGGGEAEVTLTVKFHSGLGITAQPLDTGTRPNLLDNTAFAKDWKGALTAWEILSGGVTVPDDISLDGRGAVACRPSPLSAESYTGTDGSASTRYGCGCARQYTAALRPDTVYTVSWWQKASASSQMTVNAYFSGGTARAGSPCVFDGVLTTCNAYAEHYHNPDVPGGTATEWRRHHTTFCTAGSIPSGENIVLRVYSPSSVCPQTVYIAGVKLEEGYGPTDWCASEEDRKSRKLMRDRGLWVSGTEYVNNAFYQDYVYNQQSPGGEPRYYLCAATHTADGSNAPVYNSGRDGYWEMFSHVEAIAARLVLTDTLSAQIIRAVNARIGELAIDRMETINAGGATIHIEGGEIQVFGRNNHDAPNIRFGVNGSGQAVMSYYADDGTFLYDLGPDGITQQVDAAAAKFTAFSAKSWSGLTGGSAIPAALLSLDTSILDSTTTLYTWYDGFKKVGGLKKYIWPDDTENAATSRYNGAVFTSNSKGSVDSTRYAGLAITKQPKQLQVAEQTVERDVEEIYMLPAVLYAVSGSGSSARTLAQRFNLYYKKAPSQSLYTICGRDGSAVASGTTISGYISANGFSGGAGQLTSL